MAARKDAAAGSKRKTADGAKSNGTIKKPKFEKHPPSPKDESEDMSDGDSADCFSDDAEDGGAQLNDRDSRQGPKQSDGAQSGGAFEKGRWQAVPMATAARANVLYLPTPPQATTRANRI